MIEKFGGRIHAKGEALAQSQARTKRIGTKEILQQDLPDRFEIENNDKDIVVRGPGLARELLRNDSLRDVAFLMRGVW